MSTNTIILAIAGALIVVVLLLIAGMRFQRYVQDRRTPQLPDTTGRHTMDERQVAKEELAIFQRITNDPRFAGLTEDRRRKAAREMRIKSMEKLGLSTSKRRRR